MRKLLAYFSLLIATVLVTTAMADEQSPDEVASLYLKAIKQFEARDYETALELFEAINSNSAKLPPRIIDPSRTTHSWKPYGRGLVYQANNQYLVVEPERYIAEINKILEDEHRQIYPPNLTLEWISFTEPSNDNVLNGGETGTVLLALQNIGKTVARSVNLYLDADQNEGLTFPGSLVIGDIAPGKTVSVPVKIEGEKQILPKQRLFRFIAKENFGFDSNEIKAVIRTRPFEPPKLIVTDVNMVDSNGDRSIAPAELIHVSAKVRNVGTGLAKDVKISIKTDEYVFLTSEDKAPKFLGTIGPNHDTELQFSFFTARRIAEHNNSNIEITVDESEKLYGTIHKLEVSVVEPNSMPIFAQSGQRSAIRQIVNANGMRQSVATPNENAIAVLIGNRNYQSKGVPNVDYAFNDVDSVKEWLINSMGYQEQNIIDIRDASSARFNETFGSQNNPSGKLLRYVKPGISDVFVYFTGHGAPGLIDNETYFVPVDADPNFITASGYSLSTFYQNLKRLNARQITVVLDTCFSGNSPAGMILSNISPAFINVENPLPNINNAVVFTSARSHQVSSWYHEKQHSLFTYFFLLAVTGIADLNQDRKVTVSEIDSYLSKEVPYVALRLNGIEQNPTTFGDTNTVLYEISQNKTSGFASN